MKSQVVNAIQKIVFIVSGVFLCTSVQAKMKVHRGPASKDAAIVIEYMEEGHKASAASLTIYIFPYGNYIAYRGATMHCQLTSPGTSVIWNCVGDEGQGHARLNLSNGFTSPRLLDYEIFKNCAGNCKGTDLSRALKLKKASMR